MHQGERALCERYRERVEVHAIQRGTAWQADTWSYSALVGVYLRTHDVLGRKYCAQPHAARTALTSWSAAQRKRR